MRAVFDRLNAEISEIGYATRIGRVIEIARGTVLVTGVARGTGLGDRVLIRGKARTMGGEVVRVSQDEITVLPDDPPERLAVNDPVEILGAAEIAPDSSWVGRIIDPFGNPLDGRPIQRGLTSQPVIAAAPAAATRRRLGARLSTTIAVFDTVLPIVCGQRVGLFAGSGVGKSSLLGKLARGVPADIVVIALVGERGRELREFVEMVLGLNGMARAIIVTATSDQSPLIRRRCAWTAMAVAEHFRDKGKHVLLLMDSVTRFAEAHREVALAGGEAASMRGYPPSTSHMIMALSERAGPGPEGAGDITAIFTVLVAGSDMEEPISDILRGVLDGHIVMDRNIAERGRYPAIDILRSVSRSLPHAASITENKIIGDVRKLLGAWDRSELMVQAGLYSMGSDALVDHAIRVWPSLDAFFGEDSEEGIDDCFQRLARCIA